MKRILFLLVALLPLLAVAQVKLGIVNSDEIFNAMPGKVNAEALLKEQSDKFKAEYRHMQEDFNKKYADYQAVAMDASTPETIKERRIQELQQSDKNIQAFLLQADETLKAKREELIAPILDAIQKAIEAVGEEEGMALVLDVAKTPVAYTGPYTEDITPKVKARLNLE